MKHLFSLIKMIKRFASFSKHNQELIFLKDDSLFINN